MKTNPRLLAALIVCAAPRAFANPFELYGFTPRALGMGGAMTAVGDDLGASFYNPGALLGHTKTGFGLGFADTISNLYLDRQSQSGASNNPTSQVENTPRFQLGLIFPLGGKLLKGRVVLAIGGGHPVGSLIRVQTVDQSRPQFYLYQSKAQRFALNAALGIRIVDGVSLGAGVQVTAEQVGKVNFKLDLASRQFIARDITVDLNTVPTPTAGILIEPGDRVKIGFSWRKEAQLYYAEPTNIDLGDLGALKLDVSGLAQYWPHVFSGAVSLKVTPRLLVAVQADYYLWNRAPNDQVPRHGDAQRRGFDGAGARLAAQGRFGRREDGLRQHPHPAPRRRVRGGRLARAARWRLGAARGDAGPGRHHQLPRQLQRERLGGPDVSPIRSRCSAIRSRSISARR